MSSSILHIAISVQLLFLIGCSSHSSVMPSDDRDTDSHLDTEEVWTGRRVGYGIEFTLAVGESVSFGDFSPVLSRHSAPEATGVVLDVILHRVPYEALPSLNLQAGEKFEVEGYKIQLLSTEAAPNGLATLRVTSPAP